MVNVLTLKLISIVIIKLFSNISYKLLEITIHRWQRGVIGYLILFPILPLVSQRQFYCSVVEKKPSLLVFYLIFQDMTPCLSII
jgi:hypothetical protein